MNFKLSIYFPVVLFSNSKAYYTYIKRGTIAFTLLLLCTMIT